MHTSMTMLQPELDYMMANPGYEVYSQWESLQVVSTSSNEVLAELGGGGKIRPRGQSTLAIPACMGMAAMPFKVSRVEKYCKASVRSKCTRPLFGARRWNSTRRTDINGCLGCRECTSVII